MPLIADSWGLQARNHRWLLSKQEEKGGRGRGLKDSSQSIIQVLQSNAPSQNQTKRRCWEVWRQKQAYKVTACMFGPADARAQQL
eukprot:1143650-Pelagomonas_calceolata.AAC.2